MQQRKTMHHEFQLTTKKFYECSITYPTVFFCLSVVIYFGGVIGIGIARCEVVKIIFSIFISLAAGKLFVIGHDACLFIYPGPGDFGTTLSTMVSPMT
jgi:hypothetical protein